MKLIKLFSTAILALSITMISCSGDDGKDGADGIDGINGTNGQDGTKGDDGINGQDGTDGVGFNELAKFGYITLKMDGVRADNEAFQDSTSFKFTPVEGGDLEQFNSLSYSMVGEDIVYDFFIGRFLSSPDDAYQNSYLSFYLEMANPGQTNQELNLFSYNISSYPVIGEDKKYFIINQSYDNFSPEIDDFQISDVMYDSETQHLAFSFSLTVNEFSNVTNHPLNLSATVDVFVLEHVEEP
jgi:Collagen triple helix repeat (20 copies).